MKIKLLLFASARDCIGQAELMLDLPDGATVGNLRQRLVELYPRTKDLLAICAVSVNQNYANNETQLASGLEVAIIPPVSGG